MKNDRADTIFASIIHQLTILRMAQGISHESLAQKIGVTRPAISHIESGKRKPSLLISIKLAEALDKNFSDVVRHAENSEKT